MKTLGFKQITEENWLSPDKVSGAFARFSPSGEVVPLLGTDWLKHLLQPVLSQDVPGEIHKLYEVARGALVYGWFFYPLYTLGLEQLTRVGEAAVTAKCLEMGAPGKIVNFEEKINWLAGKQAISVNDVQSWHSLRGLRNIASHPETQSIYTPGNAISFLEGISKQVNALFSNIAKF